MGKLESLSLNYLEEEVSISKMERGYLSQVIQLCLSLLRLMISLKVSQKWSYQVSDKSGHLLERKGLRFRKYLSLFGMIEFRRPSYWSKASGMVYVVDEALDMPQSLWSYNLQELVGNNASEVHYRESVNTINILLGLGLNATGSERNVERLGGNVSSYYESKAVEVQEEAVCFCGSFDGKGVPKIKDKADLATSLGHRLGRGEKRGVKQMATVGVMSHFLPKKRSVESIIGGLMGLSLSATVGNKREQASTKPDNGWHQGIHRRAFLADQDKCIDYGLQYIKERMIHPNSRLVVPIDAGIGLEDKVLKYVKAHGLEAQFDGIILDIIHVSEYVWACANAVLGETSAIRAEWVRAVLEDLLNSKTNKVIEDLEKIIEKDSLSISKQATVQKAVTYFTNHQHKMDYKAFLDKGYPVSSALVESSCKHLVKDRMEQSGMRWSSKGAQNMMDVRAVKLNGDMEDFIAFMAKNDRKKELNIAA